MGLENHLKLEARIRNLEGSDLGRSAGSAKGKPSIEVYDKDRKKGSGALITPAKTYNPAADSILSNNFDKVLPMEEESCAADDSKKAKKKEKKDKKGPIAVDSVANGVDETVDHETAKPTKEEKKRKKKEAENDVEPETIKEKKKKQAGSDEEEKETRKKRKHAEVSHEVEPVSEKKGKKKKKKRSEE